MRKNHQMIDNIKNAKIRKKGLIFKTVYDII